MMKIPVLSQNAYTNQNAIPKTEQEFVLRMLDMIPDDAVRFRLSNLVIWYIRQAVRQKFMYYLLNIVAMAANLIILIVNTAHDFIPCPVNLVTTILAAFASGALSINSLGHYKDNWMRYRTSAEVLKEQISQYVIKIEACRERNKGTNMSCLQACSIHGQEEYGCPLTSALMSQVNEHVTDEISAWKQCNEKETDETENSKK